MTLSHPIAYVFQTSLRQSLAINSNHCRLVSAHQSNPSSIAESLSLHATLQLDAREATAEEVEETLTRYFTASEQDLIYRISRVRGSPADLKREIKNRTLSTSRYVEAALFQYEQDHKRPNLFARLIGVKRNDQSHKRA